MGQGLGSQGAVLLGALALVEPVRHLVVSDDAVSRFDKSPAQVLVAIAGVIAAFGLAVAEPLAVDAAAVGRELTHGRETVDVARYRLRQ